MGFWTWIFGIGVASVIVFAVTWALCDIWERSQEHRAENVRHRSQAKESAPVTETWLEDVAWTPWASTISRWAMERRYEWTDWQGNVHIECDKWEELY